MAKKTLLMIAYHFPPSAEVSGVLRTLSMARHLAEEGWRPIILAPAPAAYPSRLESTLDLVPPGCEVVRTFALDARRHLGLRGRYPQLFALPDRWSTWRLSAVPEGLGLIERFHPRAIWSTYPIATAHWIAAGLHRRTGLPWIADFRDPVMPPAGLERGLIARSRARLERRTVREADVCVFVTERARALYAQRYAQTPHGAFEVIPNGFDERDFAHLEAVPGSSLRKSGRPLVLVHSGVLYPQGRNPEPFFRAVSSLLGSGRLDRGSLRVVLRGSGPESYLGEMLRRYRLEEVVELAPPVSRDAALVEQCNADGLLLFQGREFNAQVPAKIYEYFRVGRPIFGLVDEAGESARLITREGVGLITNIEDSVAITGQLTKFLAGVRDGVFPALQGGALMKYSRRAGAAQLIGLLERLAP